MNFIAGAIIFYLSDRDEEFGYEMINGENKIN